MTFWLSNSVLKRCLFMATLFRGKGTALEKQYEINRTTVSRNMTRFEQAEKVVGHLNMFRPDVEFIAGLAHAWADAMQKGYEIENLLITQAVIDSEIMPGVRTYSPVRPNHDPGTDQDGRKQTHQLNHAAGC